MKPMLAFKVQQYGHTLSNPFYVQPKLNGVRALCNGSGFQSRDEHLWNNKVLAHLHEQVQPIFARFPNFVTDGELYRHGLSLQKINQAVAVNRHEPTSVTPTIEYHIFDLLDCEHAAKDFSYRAEQLEAIQALISYHGLTHIKVVPTHLCGSMDLTEPLYKNYLKAGYEGLMYRSLGHMYGLKENCGNKENRWKCLLKRKERPDKEFRIVDFTLTTGKKGEPGFQVTCEIEGTGQTFNVGSGLSDEDLEFYKEESPIGQWAKVGFDSYSDDGIPKQGTILAILNS